MTDRLTDEQLTHRLNTIESLANLPPFNRTNDALRSILKIIIELGNSVHAAEHSNEDKLDPNLMLGLGMIVGIAVRHSGPRPAPRVDQ